MMDRAVLVLEVDAQMRVPVEVLADRAAELVDPRRGLAVGAAVEVAVQLLDVEIGSHARRAMHQRSSATPMYSL